MVSKQKVSKRENPFFPSEDVTDTRKEREKNIDPSIREAPTAPTPSRKEQECRYCLVCQNLIFGNSDTPCERCGISENTAKKRAFSKWHDLGASGM